MQSIKKSRGAILMSNKIDLEQGRGRTGSRKVGQQEGALVLGSESSSIGWSLDQCLVEPGWLRRAQTIQGSLCPTGV